MKNVFSILVMLLVTKFAAWSQTPGFKASGGATFPHILTVASNQTFLVDRGGGLSPANITFSNLTTEISRKISSVRNVMSRENFNLWSAVQSNLPVRFLLVGDSVSANVETTRNVMYAFDGWMDRGGYGSVFTQNSAPGGNVLLFYTSGSGGTTYQSVPGFWPASYTGMPNGSSVTSVADGGGVTANFLSVYYYAGFGFGTFLVETQRNGGSFGTLEHLHKSYSVSGV